MNPKTSYARATTAKNKQNFNSSKNAYLPKMPGKYF